MLFKTIFRHLNCFLLSAADDGKDGYGLKLEKLGQLFSSFSTRGGSRGRVQGVRTPPPPEMTCGFLIQLVFSKKTMWFIGVEVEQETSAPPPKKNPGSAPECYARNRPPPQELLYLVPPNKVCLLSFS